MRNLNSLPVKMAAWALLASVVGLSVPQGALADAADAQSLEAADTQATQAEMALPAESQEGAEAAGPLAQQVDATTQAEEAAGKPTELIDEIVVTARRRTERLQDVPVAVSAFGEEQLRERGIATEADLQSSTPGLQVRVTNSSNQLNYSIRGQTVDSFSNSQPAVLAYINEVQAGGVTSSAFFDMESIQVLKGPQGTLFGRNATGGAVLYQTKRPEDVLGGYLKAGVGNFDNRQAEGALNIPINDLLALRLAGMSRKRDGWQHNLYNGDRLASIDTNNGRLSLSFKNDRLSNDLVGYVAKHSGKSEGLRIRNAYNCLQLSNGVCVQGEPNPNNPNADVGDLLFATELYPEGVIGSGTLDTDNPRLIELANQMGFTGFRSFVDTATQQLDFDQVLNDQSNDSDIKHRLATNTTSFDIDDDTTVKNILGYNKVKSFQATDIDGSPFMMLRMGDETSNGGYQYNVRQFSEELQLSGKLMDNKLSYIVGVYYYDESNETDIPLKFIADYDSDPFGPAFAYHAKIDDKSSSVFAQGTYALTPAMNLTTGGRYTWEEVSISHYSDSAYAPLIGTGDYTKKVSRPSWLVSLDYRVDDDSMVYLAHRGSWRTGGWNVTSLNDTDNDGLGDVPDSFKSEKTWDLEAGWKYSGAIGEVPARLNLAAYRQAIKDVQRTVYLQITSQTGNVEKAVVKGAELDASLDLNSHLEAGGAFAYTDAKFTKPQGDVIGYTFPFGPYADAPELQWSVYVVARTRLDHIGQLSLRTDYYSNDDTYFSNLNDSIAPGTELDSYQLLNFRLALDDIAGSTLSAAAYLRNATDEEYERGGLPLGGVTATNATIAGEPRTWGVELSYRF